ncbi:MAG: hypothetical protein M3Y80_00480 [Verrucomicrobiota bacterium]|nr:hypothetical protein [Verrucomicrobiota bacterium]
MKPTSPASLPARSRDAQPLRHRTSASPKIDWSFQASAPALRGSGQSPAFTPSFRTLTDGVFSSEARRDSRFEGAVFGVIVALATWPIVLAIQAAIELTK